MPFLTGQRVDVRSNTTLPWNPGVVQGQQGHCVVVELDTPISADAWSGVTRRYSGTQLVGAGPNPVLVYEQVEKLTPGELIRPEGG